MAKLDVKVKIELSKAAGSVGFGIPLLIESGATAAKPYTECYTLEDVVAAGFEATTGIYKAAAMIFAQEHRPEKIAVCSSNAALAAAITAIADKDFRQIVVVNVTPVGEDSSVDGELIAAADYVETTKKMMFISKTKADFATFKTSLEGKKYDRTVIFVNDTDYANAALVGEAAGRAAGSFTYKFKTLKGVTAETFTDLELEALHEAGAIAYVTKAGDDVTSEGISQSGRYIDETDSIDYVIANVEYKNQKVLNNTAKVPYDNRGIALHEAATEAALREAAAMGIIAQNDDGTYDYTVSFGARSATTEADRASRVYKYGTFRFSLAGAIHDVEVFGEVTA